MRGLIFTLILLALPLAARADDSSTITYTSHRYGFALNLPGGGIISDAASDPDWKADSSAAFDWDALDPKAPLSFLGVVVVSFDDDAVDADVSDWMADEAGAENLAKMKAKLLANGAPLSLDGHSWTNARFKYDAADEGEYEIFVTREGHNLYAVYFDYARGSTGGEATARKVLASFTAPVR